MKVWRYNVDSCHFVGPIRKPWCLNIFPTSKQRDLGTIPSSHVPGYVSVPSGNQIKHKLQKGFFPTERKSPSSVSPLRPTVGMSCIISLTCPAVQEWSGDNHLSFLHPLPTPRFLPFPALRQALFRVVLLSVFVILPIVFSIHIMSSKCQGNK